LSQDEARFPMVPTLCRTLGVKGNRPIVGTWDCKDLLDVSAVVSVVTAALHTRTLERPRQATRRTGRSQTARLQALFVPQWHEVARSYSASQWPRVVVIIDKAPWLEETRSPKCWRSARMWNCIDCRVIVPS
jgi:hypothetical protein